MRFCAILRARKTAALCRCPTRWPIFPIGCAPIGKSFTGRDKTMAIATSLAHAPPLDLCFKEPAAAENWLAQHGGQYAGQSVSPTHIRLTEGTNITKLAGFTEGDFWVQNAAAGGMALALTALLDGAAEVLDLCAAPGGKTLQLAAAGHKVTALDISKTRLQRLAENLKRTNLSAEWVSADALDWVAPVAYDAVLLDAPCTATGTLRRHPDLLRHRSAATMAKLMELQAALLARAADWVKPERAAGLWCVFFAAARRRSTDRAIS